jgi:signal transduction histidine kinase/CheY-like chemotaxis protein/HPt (histidine-containing phosphotransfer) domain-containing protein
MKWSIGDPAKDNRTDLSADMLALIRRFPGAVCITDTNQAIKHIGGQLFYACGRRAADSVGQAIGTVFSDFDSTVSDHIAQTLETGEAQNWTVMHNDRVYALTCQLDPDGSEVVCTALEITQQVLLEEKCKAAEASAENANRAKSEFLSRMSHEIRTPMNTIIGMTRIGKSVNDLEKAKYCFGKIDGASAQLLNIVNDILDISKLESDKFELSVGLFKLAKVIDKVRTDMLLLTAPKNQLLTIRVDDSIPAELIGDDVRLLQVLTNLLSNAVKFSENNSAIRLTIKKVRQQQQDVTLQFAVEDQGCGMSKEQQSKLFLPFEQVDGSISRRYGGTGLGLAICKKIVGLMHGEILVQSEAGKGSTFIFTANLKVADKCDEHRPQGSITKDNIRVLAVDDNPDTLEFIKHTMNTFHIKCDVAADGFEAIDLFKQSIKDENEYNVVFVDWMMPYLNGVSTAAKICEIATDDPVVIMISVAEWSDIKEEAAKCGIYRFVQKPLYASKLLNSINQIFSLSEELKESTVPAPEYDFAGNCILLVEDIDTNREIIAAVLENTNLKIHNASNGQAAVQMFRQNPKEYDAILMDLQMPIMDGFEASRAIRSMRETEGASVPIIAMTASVLQEDIQKCLDAGMNDHVPKPIDRENLLTVLGKYLARKAAVSSVSKPAIDFSAYAEDINFSDGIARIAGKTELYLSILKKFHGKEILSSLKEKMAEQDKTQIGFILHSFKGMASNLSLPKLTNQLVVTEDRFKQGNDITADIADIEVLVNRILQIIQTL